MNDLVIFLIASVVVSALVTTVAFALIRLLVRKRTPLLMISAAAFPMLMIGIAGYAASFRCDPHGIVTIVFGMIGVASIPAAALTAWLLARRFA